MIWSDVKKYEHKKFVNQNSVAQIVIEHPKITHVRWHISIAEWSVIGSNIRSSRENKQWAYILEK
jgi:hypothetical protein